MDWRSAKSVEAKIRRLTREITAIDEFFYRGNENEDRALYAGMLERKRDDLVRSAVLQMHTAIEDPLNSMIVCLILKVKPEDRKRKQRSHSAPALRKMLFGGGSLGFDMKPQFRRGAGASDRKDQRETSGTEQPAKQVQSQLVVESAGPAREKTETEEASAACL
jgi:hypothetical protein